MKTIRNLVLERLENSRGEFFSGEELAKDFNVSRNAIWKAIKTLENDGFAIEAVPNKGYRLSKSSNVISAQGIKKYLTKECADTAFQFKLFKTVTSTNTLAKEFASQGDPEGTVVIAETQTSGKGRMGRSFFAPPGGGIYMSLVLRPKFDAEKSLFITTSAAVAVVRALKEVCGCEAGIKWVNDVYVADKKVCGILTEASLSLENGGLEYAVLGIGINIATPKDAFPDELKDVAASVLNDAVIDDVRNRVIASVLTNLMELYRNIGNRGFLDEYKKYSILIGKQVLVYDMAAQADSTSVGIPATVMGIDDSCRLIVRMDDGTQRTLYSGEVSIKQEGAATPDFGGKHEKE